MTAILSPSSHSQTEPIVGYAYVLAAEQIRQEITESLDVLSNSLAMLVGDLQGSGSDTLQITRFGGLGFAEAMTAMVSETDAIVPTGFTLGLDQVALGRYGIAKEQTYTDQILARAEMIGLEDMVKMVPQSFLATLRAGLCTTAGTFASGFGVSGSAWTFDDELNLTAGFMETEGYDQALARSGAPVTIRHAEQYTDLRNSIRNEPGLQNDARLTEALMGLKGTSGGAFDFLGLRNFASFDIATSGGDWVGGAYFPGAIAWVVANTLPVTVENPEKTTFVPEFGIVIERRSTGEIATARFAGNAFFGMAKLSATLFPQFKLTSVND